MIITLIICITLIILMIIYIKYIHCKHDMENIDIYYMSMFKYGIFKCKKCGKIITKKW